jgi:hypothetical protein
MKKCKINPILEKARKSGRNGDTILAHINPLEAIMLKKAGGSGTINPKTGLPEFGLFDNPKKWLKGSLGGATGAILGNMILPGIGGVIGGALGGAAGSKVRGRKDYLQAGIRGAGMGAILPSAASGLGSLTGSKFLTNYGNTNAILPSIGLGEKTASAMQGGGAASALPILASSGDKSDYEDLENYKEYLKSGKKGNNSDNALVDYLKNKDAEKENMSFMDKLKKNSQNYLTKPKNLLALGSTGLSLYDRMNQPKPLTPAQKGRATKEEMLAARLNPAEMAEQERYELALEHSRRRNARKKFLPEERIDIQPLYNRVSTPEEYAQTGKWINYYNNPQFAGQQVRF